MIFLLSRISICYFAVVQKYYPEGELKTFTYYIYFIHTIHFFKKKKIRLILAISYL